MNVAEPYATDPTVIFPNNIIRNLGAGAAVCWGDNDGDFSQNLYGPWHHLCQYAKQGSIAGIPPTPMSVRSGSPSPIPCRSLPLRARGISACATASGQPVAGCTGASNGLNAGVDVGLSFQGSAPDLGAKEVLCTAPIAGAPYAQSQHLCMSFNFGSYSRLGAWESIIGR